MLVIMHAPNTVVGGTAGAAALIPTPTANDTIDLVRSSVSETAAHHSGTSSHDMLSERSTRPSVMANASSARMRAMLYDVQIYLIIYLASHDMFFSYVASRDASCFDAFALYTCYTTNVTDTACIYTLAHRMWVKIVVLGDTTVMYACGSACHTQCVRMHALSGTCQTDPLFPNFIFKLSATPDPVCIDSNAFQSRAFMVLDPASWGTFWYIALILIVIATFQLWIKSK